MRAIVVPTGLTIIDPLYCPLICLFIKYLDTKCSASSPRFLQVANLTTSILFLMIVLKLLWLVKVQVISSLNRSSFIKMVYWGVIEEEEQYIYPCLEWNFLL